MVVKTGRRIEGGGITNGIVWQGNYADQSEARGRKRWNNQWHLPAGKLRRPIRGLRVEEGEHPTASSGRELRRPIRGQRAGDMGRGINQWHRLEGKLRPPIRGRGAGESGVGGITNGIVWQETTPTNQRSEGGGGGAPPGGNPPPIWRRSCSTSSGLVCTICWAIC